MINLQEYLYNKIKPIITSWDEGEIYALSFFVYSNQAFTYDDYYNVSCFAISYNTEGDCERFSELSEQRWNYAFWRQDEIYIINTDAEDDEGSKVLFDWYRENGIQNIGDEDESLMYDDKFNYIGKGPIGYYELLTVVSEVARRLQSEGFILSKFGKPIPIIVHDLEYPWYIEEATMNANPNGEAETFLKVLRDGFPE